MPSDNELIRLPSFPNHVGVAVRDVAKTVEFLSSTYAVGHAQVVGDYMPRDEELIAGQDFRVRVGIVEMGALKLELLQPLDEKSILAQFLRTKGEGLHHIAFYVPDFDAVVSKSKARGFEMLIGGLYEGHHWAYMNTDTKPGGIITEFMDFEH